MKLTLKLFLVLCLFSSVTFADGDIPGGGKTCTQNCFAGDQQTEPTNNDRNKSKPKDSVLTFIQKYLISIFGF
jgi:hypothetical protein